MRQFIDAVETAFSSTLLEGVDIPPTDYGYWITDEGKFIVVDREAHKRVLTDVLPDDKVEYPDWGADYEDAFKAGWVRVVFCNRTFGEKSRLSLIVQSDTGLIGSKTLIGIISLSRYPGIMTFAADVCNNYERFDDDKSFVAFVRRNRKPRQTEQPAELTEAVEIPDTEYGYWIKPDGSLVVVGECSHESTLRQVSDGTMTCYKDGFAVGWVRVVCDPTEHELTVDTDTGYISIKQLSTIRALSRLPTVYRYQVSIGETAKWFDDETAFLGCLRQLRVAMPKDEPLPIRPDPDIVGSHLDPNP